MSFIAWMALCGALLLFMGLASTYLRDLPVSTSVLYLGVGVAVGPVGFGWLRIDVREATPWLEHLTEVALITSLFISGLKLRLPLRAVPWRAAFRLAGPAMVISIVGVALFAHFAFGLDMAAALLLGAVLAPTDPVLASAVAVSDASDRDRLRYGLSGEAGLNDGTAFPFVVLALLWAERGGAGLWLATWGAHRLLWAVPAGLVIGYLVGIGVGRLAIALRSHQRDAAAPNDFLALALIAIAYVVAQVVGAWGFLAAFAAGVGLRHAEVDVVHTTPHPNRELAGKLAGASAAHGADEAHPHPPAEALVEQGRAEALHEPAVAAGRLVSETLSFGDTAERLLEVLLMVLIGASLAAHWDVRAVPLALALFFVIRPLGVGLALVGTPTDRTQRLLMGWFGVRGIGSLYYLTYAVAHGLPERTAAEISGLTISTVMMSVLLHGATSHPLLRRYEGRLATSGAKR